MRATGGGQTSQAHRTLERVQTPRSTALSSATRANAAQRSACPTRPSAACHRDVVHQMAASRRALCGALRSSAALAPGRRALSAAAAASAPPAALPDRIVRFVDVAGEEAWGALDVTESRARVVTRGAASGRMELSDETRSVESILPPVDPPAVFCVGLNYADHAAEVKMAPPLHPIVFTKTVNTLIGHRCAIVIPAIASEPAEVDYEAELAVVIGREAKDVPAARALDYVAGYTIANDVTARRWQGKRGGGQWTRGKCFDTFLPLGPWVVPPSRVNLADCKIRTWVNGDLVQDGNTSQMLFSVPQLIAFLSQGTTLLPGTVILTGTPAGVGYTRGVYLKAGDDVSVEGGGSRGARCALGVRACASAAPCVRRRLRLNRVWHVRRARAAHASSHDASHPRVLRACPRRRVQIRITIDGIGSLCNPVAAELPGGQGLVRTA
jgi:2-keto-4-pentenoate hydratase/2-oxohepta-3-ene-1,7-dioic acid hydratase in catechol pathway